MKTSIQTITPEIAVAMLAADEIARSQSPNSRHRDLSGFTIGNYANDIETGNWRVIPMEGLLVADTGEIINGRHRLHAILMAGKPIKTYVTTDINHEEAREMIQFIDAGRPRSVATQLWIAEGIKDTRFVVSAIRAQWGLACGSSKEQGGSSSSISACYDAQSETLDQIIHILNEENRRVASSVIGPISYYAYRHRRKAVDFATAFRTGEKLSGSSPIIWLKRTFDGMSTKKQRHRVHDRSLITASALMAFHDGRRCDAVFRPSLNGREWLVHESMDLTTVLMKYVPRYVRKQDRKIPMGES